MQEKANDQVLFELMTNEQPTFLKIEERVLDVTAAYSMNK